jgi:hypothetical protein
MQKKGRMVYQTQTKEIQLKKKEATSKETDHK